MSAFGYRSLQPNDVEAVFAVAREAWQFTYATVFDPAFIDQFVRTNYAPERLRDLVSLIEASQIALMWRSMPIRSLDCAILARRRMVHSFFGFIFGQPISGVG